MPDVKKIFDIPFYQLEQYPQEKCFVDKRNGEWKGISIQDFINEAKQFAYGLMEKGIKPGDKVAMISNNRSEWNIADIGILMAGAINVPIYPTISPDDYAFIFEHSESKLCIVSDEELRKKASEGIQKSGREIALYSFDKLSTCPHWRTILRDETDANRNDLDRVMAGVQEDDLATIIYTSGTTGRPKGVMLSHKNIVSNIMGCIDRLPCKPGMLSLSFLPVCHVYERMLLYLYMYRGISVHFAENMETIGDNLKEIKPHVFTAVPRLLEKVYDKIIAKGNDLSGIKKSLFFWAVKIGNQYELHGKSAMYKFKLKIARKLIFSKWQEALGGRCIAVASGSAALQPRLARIYLAAGIPVMEGYGLTESSPVISVNCEANDGVRIGTVGRVLSNVEVKIAEDGEILAKGPNIMLGYYKQQDLTDDVVKDGWLHTGDIGEFVEGDFLKITDRKKEIFKTSGGKYIAPQVMENKFKESGFFEQIMVVGEGEKHPSALIVPSYDFVGDWAEKHDIKYDGREDLFSNEKVIARLNEEIEKFNVRFGAWEQLKRVQFCFEEWSIEGGELTPTLKLRRKKIMEKYADLYKKIYN
jgi:long-chain acyl-CoA synthetase